MTTTHTTPELLARIDRERGYLAALVRAMARRCGLEDPDAFAAKPVTKRLDPAFCEMLVAVYGPKGEHTVRGTGRTTRMLLEALVALEVGCSVEIVAADREQVADLRTRLIGLARALGWCGEIDVPRAVVEVAWTWLGHKQSRGMHRPDVRFVDHYAVECIERGRLPARVNPVTFAVFAR